MGLTGALAFSALWSAAGWLWSRLKGRMDVADVLWGPGIAVLNTLILTPWSAPTVPKLVYIGLVWVWALRLAVHISMRNARKSEDARYAAWRKEWGVTVGWRSYLQVFLLQSLLMLPMAAPAFAMAPSGTGLDWSGWVGIVLFLAGMAVESVADRQLAVFLGNPENRNQVMDRGLWAWSRHPNYLGEVILWWGLGLFGGWVGLIASATITWLILKVSGVPMLERKWAEDPKYAAYLDSIPRFLPFRRVGRVN
jgi:steroid 5-alpha reductase family enzyme